MFDNSFPCMTLMTISQTSIHFFSEKVHALRIMKKTGIEFMATTLILRQCTIFLSRLVGKSLKLTRFWFLHMTSEMGMS